MPRADLLVVNASPLLTLAGPAGPRRGRDMRELAAIQDGAVAIRHARIIATGTTRRLRASHSAKRTIDAEGSVVMPGFVDAHNHLPYAGSRAFELPMKLDGKSYQDILRAGGGIHRTVADTRRASLARLTGDITSRLETMLQWGTTTTEAKSGYGLNLAGELKQLRAVRDAQRKSPVDLVPTFLGAHAIPAEHARRRGEYVRLVAETMIPQVAIEGLAEFCDVFLDQDAFTARETQRVLGAARAHGLKTKLHADEFGDDDAARLAADLGCTSADHLQHASPQGIRALARSPTTAVLNPGVNLTSFLPRFAPARALIDAGAAVALGTDHNPNCNVWSMVPVVQWATYLLRMHPNEAITAATLNAAHALGRGHESGSLEPGKLADLLILDTEDPLDLVYRMGVNPVRTVIKRGRVAHSS